MKFISQRKNPSAPGTEGAEDRGLVKTPVQKQQVLRVGIDKIVLKKEKNLFTSGGVYAKIYSVKVGQQAGQTPISLQNAALPLHTFYITV